MSDMLDLVARSEQNLALLSDPVYLGEAATRIATLAQSFGSTFLMAASPAAERLVGAAMLISPSLRALARSDIGTCDPMHPVLLVDVNLASGTSMATAAQLVRRAGATNVLGAALHALAAAVGPTECGLDRLEIIQPESR